jgi:hypothetical protein
VIDLPTTLFWLRLIQLLLAIPLLALAGQGLVHVLTRTFGQDPNANFFYRLLQTVASPFTRVCRWITHACVGAGLPVGPCLQGR